MLRSKSSGLTRRQSQRAGPDFFCFSNLAGRARLTFNIRQDDRTRTGESRSGNNPGHRSSAVRTKKERSRRIEGSPLGCGREAQPALEPLFRSPAAMLGRDRARRRKNRVHIEAMTGLKNGSETRTARHPRRPNQSLEPHRPATLVPSGHGLDGKMSRCQLWRSHRAGEAQLYR
jgi:hypothetical protein